MHHVRSFDARAGSAITLLPPYPGVYAPELASKPPATRPHDTTRCTVPLEAIRLLSSVDMRYRGEGGGSRGAGSSRACKGSGVQIPSAPTMRLEPSWRPDQGGSSRFSATPPATWRTLVGVVFQSAHRLEP